MVMISVLNDLDSWKPNVNVVMVVMPSYMPLVTCKYLSGLDTVRILRELCYYMSDRL